jgi:diguanylate cyclase (GGDEF)-like protein
VGETGCGGGQRDGGPAEERDEKPVDTISLLNYINALILKKNFLSDCFCRCQADLGHPFDWKPAMTADSSSDSRILIVDDDSGIRTTMHEFIGMSGFDAQSAASAEDALAMMAEQEPDVVITDISLPGIDGLELTDRIKKKYEADVIVITGYSAEYSYEEAISKGASDFLFKPVRFAELLLRLRRVLKERQLTQERVKMLEQLQRLATTDGLTKLFNSRHFYNQLAQEVDRTIRYSPPLSLMLMDIDHFKRYNDTYGHLEGDKVLVRLAQIIESCLRKLDTAYRYGGEEFTVILPETTADEAETVAQRIRSAVERERFHPRPDEAVQVTVSIGATQYDSNEELSGFIKRADIAMYSSKQRGRNQVTIQLAE